MIGMHCDVLLLKLLNVFSPQNPKHKSAVLFWMMEKECGH